MSKLKRDPLSETGTSGWIAGFSVRSGAYGTTHLQTVRIQMQTLILNVRPLNDGFGGHHISFLESRHIYMIMVVYHATLSSNADSRSDVVTGDHSTRDVCVQQGTNCRAGAGLELVFENDKTQEAKIRFDFLSALYVSAGLRCACSAHLFSL